MRHIRSRPALCLAAAILFLLIQPGQAYAAGVVLTTTEPKIVSKDGVNTVTITLLNINNAPGELTPSVTAPSNCKVSAEPKAIAANRATEVKLTFDDACDVTKVVKAHVDVKINTTAGTPTTVATRIVLDISPASESPPLGVGQMIAITAVLAAIAIVILILCLRHAHSRLKTTNREEIVDRLLPSLTTLPEMNAEERRQFDALSEDEKGQFDRQREAKFNALKGDRETEREGLKETLGEVTLRRELQHLGTSFSFKDSWVANTTIGATALIALFAAGDVLETVFGATQKDAIAFIAVTGALAAVLVNLGPLVVKLFGKNTEIPTVGGLYVAGVLVVLGSMTQVWGATLQIGILVEEHWSKGWAIFVGIIAVGVTVAVEIYACKSLIGLVVKGVTSTKESESEEVKAAKIVALAIATDSDRDDYEDDVRRLIKAGRGVSAFTTPSSSII